MTADPAFAAITGRLDELEQDVDSLGQLADVVIATRFGVAEQMTEMFTALERICKVAGVPISRPRHLHLVGPGEGGGAA